jgi:hypothetical protein
MKVNIVMFTLPGKVHRSTQVHASHQATHALDDSRWFHLTRTERGAADDTGRGIDLLRTRESTAYRSQGSEFCPSPLAKTHSTLSHLEAKSDQNERGPNREAIPEGRKAGFEYSLKTNAVSKRNVIKSIQASGLGYSPKRNQVLKRKLLTDCAKVESKNPTGVLEINIKCASPGTTTTATITTTQTTINSPSIPPTVSVIGAPAAVTLAAPATPVVTSPSDSAQSPSAVVSLSLVVSPSEAGSVVSITPPETVPSVGTVPGAVPSVPVSGTEDASVTGSLTGTQTSSGAISGTFTLEPLSAGAAVSTPSAVFPSGYSSSVVNPPTTAIGSTPVATSNPIIKSNPVSLQSTPVVSASPSVNTNPASNNNPVLNPVINPVVEPNGPGTVIPFTLTPTYTVSSQPVTGDGIGPGTSTTSSTVTVQGVEAGDVTAAGGARRLLRGMRTRADSKGITRR